MTATQQQNADSATRTTDTASRRWGDEVYGLATRDEPGAERFLKLFFPGLRRQPDKRRALPPARQEQAGRSRCAHGSPLPRRPTRRNDTMMHTANSQLLADRLPLRTYPDANHGFLSQHPELFADHLAAFLNY